MELGCLGKDSRNIEKHAMFSLENNLNKEKNRKKEKQQSVNNKTAAFLSYFQLIFD